MKKEEGTSKDDTLHIRATKKLTELMFEKTYMVLTSFRAAATPLINAYFYQSFAEIFVEILPK